MQYKATYTEEPGTTASAHTEGVEVPTHHDPNDGQVTGPMYIIAHSSYILKASLARYNIQYKYTEC